MTENLRNVAKTMEVLKENMFAKMGNVDSSMVELNKRMGKTIEAFNEHALTTNQTLEKEFNRVEKVNNKLEGLLKSELQDMRKTISGNEDNNESWRKAFEQKNHSFFKELTNAMKSLKKNLLKEKFEREST